MATSRRTYCRRPDSCEVRRSVADATPHELNGAQRVVGACSPLEPGAERVVPELAAIVDERSIDRRIGQLAVSEDLELDDDRKAVLALVERGEIGRESLRQHRKYRHAGVHGGRIGRGMLVGGGAEHDE